MLDSVKAPVRRLVPAAVKNQLEDSTVFDWLHGRTLARGSKRLDICAAQMAHNLHLAQDVRLQGRTCLEIGSGWVLTHSLVMYLLGAERVIATDIGAHARPEALGIAVQRAQISLVRDVLAPFEGHEVLRERLQRLASIKRFSFDVLEKLGIHYVAPVDLVQAWIGEPVDFAYSASVLEHVPAEQVPDLLGNLAANLRPGGAMIHDIHLEDHMDIAADPFRFLGEDNRDYGVAAQTARGNRIRASEWLQLFGALPDCENRVLYLWERREVGLPAVVDSGVRYTDEADLRSSHLGMLTSRS